MENPLSDGVMEWIALLKNGDVLTDPAEVATLLKEKGVSKDAVDAIYEIRGDDEEYPDRILNELFREDPRLAEKFLDIISLAGATNISAILLLDAYRVNPQMITAWALEPGTSATYLANYFYWWEEIRNRYNLLLAINEADHAKAVAIVDAIKAAHPEIGADYEKVIRRRV